MHRLIQHCFPSCTPLFIPFGCENIWSMILLPSKCNVSLYMCVCVCVCVFVCLCLCLFCCKHACWCCLLHTVTILCSAFLYQSHRVICGAQCAKSLMLPDSKDLGLSHPSQTPTKAGFHICSRLPTTFFTPTVVGQEPGIQKSSPTASLYHKYLQLTNQSSQQDFLP